MKVRYYIIIAFFCFGMIAYYTANDYPCPWTVGIILFIIGELSFGIGMGKMLNNGKKEIWSEDNPDI